MELRHLRDFVAVAEIGSVTRAATKIRVAQPSLTRQLKNLEEELGVRLLNRSHTGVSLTDEGRAFLLSAKRVLALTAESVAALRRTTERDQPQLAIGYVASVHCELLTQTLTDFRREHPDVGVNLFEMRTDEQLSALEESKLHIGFIAPERDVNGTILRVARITQHDILVAVPRNHALCRKPRLARGDLKTCFVVGFAETCWPGWRNWISQILGASGLHLQILQEAENEAAALKLVGFGLGVAFVPEALARIPYAGVRFRPLDPAAKINSFVVWRIDDQSKYVGQYIDVVKRRAARRH